MANRYDFVSSTSKIKRTPQGFWRLDARFTRCGVFTYRRSDGTQIKEFRPPEEVFDANSMASIEDAPLTDTHKGMVSPKNVASLQVGHVSAGVARSGIFLSGSVVVQRADMIEAVDKKERIELSAGYTCDIEDTQGEYEGERYDAVQRNIVYNHVGIGPSGWGRAGSEVALRLDGQDPDEAELNETRGNKETTMETIEIVFDGITYQIEVPKALAGNFKAAMARLDSEKSDNEKIKSEFEALQLEHGKLKAKYDAETSVEAIQEAAQKRAELVGNARAINQKIDVSKSDREIKTDALEACGYSSEELRDKDDSYINGAFEVALKTLEKKRADSEKRTDSKSEGPMSLCLTRADEQEQVERSADQAREEMIERNRTLWQN
jgi:hypothetical protein